MPYSWTFTTRLLAKDEKFDDPAQQAFQEALVKAIKDCTTSYGLYIQLFKFIIAHAGDQFLDGMFADLEFAVAPPADPVKGMNTISLKLTAKGAANLTRGAEMRYISTVVAFFGRLTAPVPAGDNEINRIRAEIQRIYGGSDAFYQKDGRPANDILALGKSLVSAVIDGDLTKTIAVCAGVTNAIILKKPVGWNQVAAILAGGKKASDLANFFNDAKVAVSLRFSLCNFLLREFDRRCCMNPTQSANRNRVNRVLAALGYSGKKLPDEIVPGTQEYGTWMKAIKVELHKRIASQAMKPDILSTDLLFSGGESVQAACQQWLAMVDDASGATMLRAADTEYRNTEAVAQHTTYLVAELLGQAHALIENIQVTGKWIAADGVAPVTIAALADMRPYAFYDRGPYRSAIHKMRLPDDGANGTSINSLDIPLVETFGNAVRLFNCEVALYLIDNTQPAMCKYIVNGVKKGEVSLVKGGNPDAQRALIQTVWNLYRKKNFLFTFQRSYICLYVVSAAFVLPQIMWRKTSGLGNDLGRPDEVVEEDYLWRFTGDIKVIRSKLKQYAAEAFDFSRVAEIHIGAFLGLAPENMVSENYLVAEEDETNESGYAYRKGKEPEEKNADPEDEAPLFVLCNTPTVPPTGKGKPLVTAGHLSNFTFEYYRRIGFQGLDNEGDEEPATSKVVKFHDAKNRPFAGDVLEEDTDDDVIGISMPLSMNIERNYVLFRKGKGNWPVIKNKGNSLKKNFAFRKNAGKEMLAILPFLPQQPREKLSALSANYMANEVLGLDGREAWQKMKATRLQSFPTDQEWCHLQGHGDNGKERVGNFVSGSEHCNTEQLAIENGQRPTTNAQGADYILRSSAYLIPDDSMKTIGDKYYLDVPRSGWLENAYMKNLSSKSSDLQEKSDVISNTITNPPVASFIRYKVLRKIGGAAGYEMVIDHVFEGQSEFFDQNQYNILTETVRYILDEASFFRDLADFIRQRAA